MRCFCLQAAVTKRRDELERDHADAVSRHELELGAMTENLATLRAEMSTSAQRLATVETANGHLLSEKLGL